MNSVEDRRGERSWLVGWFAGVVDTKGIPSFSFSVLSIERKNLRPDLHVGVPTGRTKGATVSRNAKRCNALIASRKISFAFCLQRVPDDDRVIGIRSIEQATRRGEGDRCRRRSLLRIFRLDCVFVDFTERSNIEESASSIFRTRTEGCVVGEELNDVDIVFVLREDVSGFRGTNIPREDRVIARTRNKEFFVICESDVHNITSMLSEDIDLLSRVNIPQNTSVITGRSENLAAVEEATTGEESIVPTQFSRNLGRVLSTDFPNRTDVIQSSRSDEVSRRRITASHHPIRWKIDRVHLETGDRIPNDEFSVLGRRRQGRAFLGPLHGIDLGQMTFQGATETHINVSYGSDARAGRRQGLIGVGSCILFDLILEVFGFFLGGFDVSH